jgi:hypothetical protein
VLPVAFDDVPDCALAALAAVSPDCGSVLFWLAPWFAVDDVPLCELLLAVEAEPLCGLDDEAPLTQVSQGGCVVDEVAEEEVGGTELDELEFDDPVFDEDAPLCGSEEPLAAPEAAPEVELGGFEPLLPTVSLFTIVAPGAADRAISSARCLS